MTLRHLKIFITVYEEQSITKAAEILSIAQPSVSLAISEIEKNYGIKLFDRINQRIYATDSGKMLYSQACHTINSFNDFEEMAYHEKALTKVNIGSSLTIGQYLVPKIVDHINHTYPDIKLNVVINQTKTIENMVLRGELDFALVESDIESPSLTVQPFSTDKLVAVAGRNYLVDDYISLSNLKNQKLILREKGSAARDLFDDFLEKNKVTVKPYIESISTPVILSCLLNNLGLSVLPLMLVKEYVHTNRLKLIQIENADFNRVYNIIKLKNKILTPEQREILNTSIILSND